MYRRTVYQCEQSAPYQPSSRVRMRLDPQVGPVDLSNMVIQGELDLTGGLLNSSGVPVHALMYMRDGVASLIRDVRVSDASGRLIETVRRNDILQALKTDYVHDPLGEERRRLINLAGTELAIVSADDEPYYPVMTFTLHLHELGLGLAALDVWTRGLDVELLLNNTVDPFTRLRTNRTYLCANKSATGGFNTVSLLEWPADTIRNNSNGGHGPDIQVGDDVQVTYLDGADATIGSATVTRVQYFDRGRCDLAFAAALPSTGVATNIVINTNHNGITQPVQPVAATVTAAPATEHNEIPFLQIPEAGASYFWSGMAVTIRGVDVYNGAAGTVITHNTTITAVSEPNLGLVDISLAEPITVTPDAAAAGELADIVLTESGEAVASVVWNFRRLEFAVSAATEKPATGPVMIRSSETIISNFPTGTTSGEMVLHPSSANMSETLGLLSVPVNTAAATADTGRDSHLIGYNDGFRDYQILLDGIPAPLQRVNIQRTTAPINFRQVANTIAQVVPEGRAMQYSPRNLVLGRPFQKGGIAMDTSGRRLAINYELTRTFDLPMQLVSYIYYNQMV